MEQTFELNSFIGKQFYTIAKRFCKTLELNKPCKAIIDTEEFVFLVTNNTITVSK
jgi:hypothetical protein